jgi:hypothetical protein
MNTISVNGKEYEVRTISHKGYNYTVGSPELHAVLELESLTEIEEDTIDDQILYYCDSNEWNMTDKELKKLLKETGAL